MCIHKFNRKTANSLVIVRKGIVSQVIDRFSEISNEWFESMIRYA